MNDIVTDEISLNSLLRGAKEIYKTKVTGIIAIDNFVMNSDSDRIYPYESWLPTNIEGNYQTYHYDNEPNRLVAVFAFELWFSIN